MVYSSGGIQIIEQRVSCPNDILKCKLEKKMIYNIDFIKNKKETMKQFPTLKEQC